MSTTVKTLIEARIDRLESNFALLRLEWNESMDKMALLYDRTRKRIKVEEKARDAQNVSDPTPDPEIPQSRDDILNKWKRDNGVT